MKITLITDAWKPQVNGVTRTWTHVIREWCQAGHETHIIHPELFKTIQTPRYPEIRLAIRPYKKLEAMIQRQKPDAIHIATEGPLGLAARKYCLRNSIQFTTSYHTQFPKYLNQYYKIPISLTYRFIRWFHGPAQKVLAPTKQVCKELNEHGITQTQVWGRGVDTKQFRPNDKPVWEGITRPIFLYAGRVASEKNIEAFLKLSLPGSKAIVGDGPQRKKLEHQFPEAKWVGYQFGDDLAEHYADADVFVFPSLTDTFGIVMLEANACGLPIAAYPVTGPIDVVQNGITGVMDNDLRKACLKALRVNPQNCLQYARNHSWKQCADVAFEHISGARAEHFNTNQEQITDVENMASSLNPLSSDSVAVH